MKTLNLEKMMEITESIENIKFTGFINEEKLMNVGVGFMPIEGENTFENMLDGMVLKHIDSGIEVKQIVRFVEDVKDYTKVESEYLRKELEKEQKRNKELQQRVLDRSNKIDVLEKELEKLKCGTKQKKKRGKKSITKVDTISDEEQEIIDFARRYNPPINKVNDKEMAFGTGLGTPAKAPKVTAPIDDEDIPF